MFAWTSTPGVQTCWRVLLVMFSRKMLMGKNAPGVGAGNCTGNSLRSSRSWRW